MQKSCQANAPRQDKSLTLHPENQGRTHNKRYNKCGYACSLKHLKSLYTFPEKSGQVPDSSGQVPEKSGQVPDSSGQVPEKSGQVVLAGS